MELKIGQMYLFPATTKDMWDSVKKTYSDLKNSDQVFEIRCKLETKQGNHCVTQYYTDLQVSWKELDLFIKFDCCLECTLKYRRSIEKEKVFDFLAGLNEDLDEVKGRVLVNKIVSSLNEDFSEVKREESQRKMMLGEEKDSINNPMEGSTLTSKGGKNGYHGDYIIGRVCCDHCNKLGHT